MKVLIVEGNLQYHEMFRMYGWEVTEDILEADLVQFTGGADVHPSQYGEECHPKTMTNPDRDMRERELYIQAQMAGIPCAGICRGGQFLNVLNGGKLYQHVDGHAISGTHEVVELDTGDCYQVSSTHHQMMRPANHGKVLAHSWDASYKERVGEDGEVVRDLAHIEGDTEVVLYPETKSLCFQPHPEFVVHSEKFRECADFYFRYLEELY